MKKNNLLLALTLLSSLLFSTYSLGSEDNENDDDGKHRPHFKSSLDVAPVNNTLYRAECSECHMAYQPGLLPARSWKKLMNGLDKHFGDNAELNAQTQKRLTQYLLKNAANHANYKRSKAIMRSLPRNATPLRISKTRYFLRKHDELPRRIVQDNPKVKSYSRCDACHTKADKGSYNEHQVRIPGHGKWED